MDTRGWHCTADGDVGDVEVDELGVVVVARAKGDGEAYLPQRSGRALDHPRERLGGEELVVRHLKRSKASTESMFRPTPLSMRVLGLC